MLSLPRGERKVASKKDHDLHTEAYILPKKELTHQLSDFKMHFHLNSYTVDVRTPVTQGQITFPYRVLQRLWSFNPSYLKHCWYQVCSAQLHLISVPAVESKCYKDSRSKVKSTSWKGINKANLTSIHLIKEQRTCHTQALSMEKLKTGKFWSIPKIMPKQQHIVLRKTRLGWFRPFSDNVPLRKQKMVTRVQVYNALTSTLLNILDLHLAGWF